MEKNMFEKIYDKIEKANSIVIFGHENPDGDCYGSEIGLKDAIISTWPNKKVYAIGTGLPYLFNRLGKMDQVSDKIIENSLAFVVDFNIISRAEDKRISLAKDFVKIDHHISPSEFKEGIEVKDTTSSSSAQLILEFVEESKMKLTKNGAEALFVGLVMDTGRFLFLEQDARSFITASKLVKYGVDTKSLYNLMYQTEESAIALKGFIYSNYKKTKDGLIYLVLEDKTIKHFNMTSNEAAGSVNLLSNIKGYPIWAFFLDLGNGKMRVELRSGNVPVQPIALKYGGGGHANAAGISSCEFSYELIDKIVKDLNDAIINNGGK